MFNSNLRFPFPLSFFLNLTFLVESVCSFFFLTFLLQIPNSGSGLSESYEGVVEKVRKKFKDMQGGGYETIRFGIVYFDFTNRAKKNQISSNISFHVPY